MNKSTLSFIKSKLYEEGQATLSVWADGSSSILSRLLEIPLSWEYEAEPVFKPESSSAFSVIWLPAKKKAEDLVSPRLHEIFNLNFKSQITTGKYSINFEIQELQDLTLFMEIRRLQLLALYVSPDKKTYLTIDLYPILYYRDKGVWLDSFTITYTYNEKEVIFDRKINALYSGAKPKNLSDKEKESMLKLTRRIVPSMSEILFALVDSTEVETLGYKERSDSDTERMSYAFFIPGETSDYQGLILNWGFSLNLIHTTY